MTYQTLRRKADKQWMKLIPGNDGITQCSEPHFLSIGKSTIEALFKSYSGKTFNWSLYEIIEVAVIPVDEMPSDDIVQKHIESVRHESGQPMMDEQTFYEGAMWYKSQILKP